MTVPLLVALGIGAAIALQTATVGHLSGEVHPLTISLALLLSGVAVASTWASVRHAWPEVLAVTGRWWWLPLGIAGWAIVAALGWTASRLGVAVALAVVVGSQLTVGLVVDAIRGTGTVSWRAVGGVILVVAGAALLSSNAGEK